MSDWNLDNFSKVLETAMEVRNSRYAEYLKQLGSPVLFVPDVGDEPTELESKFGTGYWTTPEGHVLTMRRYANGYDVNTRIVYERGEIERLWRLSEFGKV